VLHRFINYEFYKFIIMAKPKPKNEMENYGVYLEKAMVEKAKTFLEIGQKLSPVINDLLKRWVEKKEEEVKK